MSPTLSIRSAPVLAVACALVFGACEEAIAADGALVPDPSAAVFGPVRGVREELTISLTNIARGPVTLESISIEGQVGRDFSIDARGLPATVASGGRYVFTLVRAADARDAIVDAALIVRASLEREPILRFPLFSGRARLLGGGTVDGKAPGGSFFEMSVGPPVGAPSHRPIAIELEASHRNGVAVSLFARWGRPATPFDHDARAAADRSPTQTLRIAPRDDELFLLVGANTEDGTPADITVRVERPPIALVSSTPE
ncbi:MAG TPA: hypothetical protein VK116_12605, partial [Planctomycetota bacterium]|nr:hypothetical protein [Planctomycetota bacterium]